MRAFWYTAIVKVVVLLGYTLTLLRIATFSRETRMKDVLASSNNSTLDAEIDICYPLDLSRQDCYGLEDRDNPRPKEEPKECEKKDDKENNIPIGCCTKGLNKPNAIIDTFKDKIENLVRVTSQNKTPEQDYLIQSDQICVKHVFKDLEQSDDSRRSIDFEVQSSESNYQNFDIHFSFVRKYADGEEYVATRRNLIRRNCWIMDDKKKTRKRKCLETGKDVVVEIEYFSIKYLEEPFDTRCKKDNETQVECYEKCVKKEKPYYLMSFNRTEEVELDFEPHDYTKCARACDRPNCFTAAFFISGIDERVNKTYLERKTASASNESEEIQERFFPGLIILTARSASNGLEAIPVLSQQRFIWMVSVSVAVFMGFDCYGIFVRTTKIYGKTGNNKKSPKRPGVRIFFALFIFSASCTLAYFCEKILFDFGAYPGIYNETYVTEVESMKERNVSLSVCFNLCDVWNGTTKCNEESVRNMTLGELETSTTDVAWFRKRASLKNNVKWVPIRQREKIIPTFYRDLKKCWLINHETQNVLPHLSVQRKSIIHLTLQPGLKECLSDPSKNDLKLTPSYEHFYIEDGQGFAFPSIDAHPTKKSVLHSVVEQYEKDACVDFSGRNVINGTIYPGSRDDLVQERIVNEFVNKHQSLPVFVNVKIRHGTDKRYLEMPFKQVERKEELDLIEEAEKNVTVKQCTRSFTTLTHHGLLAERLGNDDACDKDGQYIVVNLTPILFEKKYHERESYLVIVNRFISFVTLFTCYSVAEVVKNTIGTFIYSRIRRYNFRFVKRISYIFVIFAYMIHMSILIHGMTHSGHKIYDTEIMKTFQLPVFRVCYEHMYANDKETVAAFVDWEEVNGPNVTMLNQKNLQFKHLVDRIHVYDEAQNYTALDLDELTKRSDFIEFYIDHLKCFSFKIDKVYDGRNPVVQKSEKLVEIQINLKFKNETNFIVPKNLENGTQRVFLFLNDDRKTLDLSQDKPFESDATIHYLTRAYSYEDNYWAWNNFDGVIRRLFLGEESYGLFEYLDRLAESFGDDQDTTTTAVPMYTEDSSKRAKLFVRNRKFSSYIHFRSIDAPYKNAFDFAQTVGVERYYLARYTENRTEQRPDKLRLSFKPNLVRMTTRFINTYTAIELFFHMMALTKVYFKFNFIEIPELFQRTYPIAKFFGFLCAYGVVIGLLRVFDYWFKVAKRMEIKYS